MQSERKKTVAVEVLDSPYGTSLVIGERIVCGPSPARAKVRARFSANVSDIEAALREASLTPPGAAAPQTTVSSGEPFQQRVQPWMLECFGAEVAADRLERSDRFIEEALELVQASGYSKDRAHQLVEYVFGRDQGEINQEVGGVMVTLAAFCLAHGFDMHAAAETELARVWTKVDQIRAKQASKPNGSALPVPITNALTSTSSAERDRVIEECAKVADRHREEHGLAMAADNLTPDGRMMARSGLRAARAIAAALRSLKAGG